MDRISKEHRSWNMSRIKNRNTKPELIVRSLLHRMGYRFTVNGPKNTSLPGKPDIVLPKYKTVIFVHGCFWHRHKGCKYAYNPKTKKAFWNKKLADNVARDKKAWHDLKKLGWQAIMIWECKLSSPQAVRNSLGKQLSR
jgi:DNA mismatch endonuclease (patch repair protein)